MPAEELPMEMPDEIYQIRVTLEEPDCNVWRRIQVPAGYSLWDLHIAIENALGLVSYDFHQFRMEGEDFYEFDFYGWPSRDPDDVLVLASWDKDMRDVLAAPGDSIEYEHDLAIDATFTVELEAVLPWTEEADPPLCVAGETPWEAVVDDEPTGVPFDPHGVVFDDPLKRWRLALYPSAFGGAFHINELDYLHTDFLGVDKALDLYFRDAFGAFRASPEGEAYCDAFDTNGFAIRCFIDFCFGYFECSPATLDEIETREILTEIFPRKVVLDEPENAYRVIIELRAFFRFLKNQYETPNADAILAVLDEIEPEFKAIMNDPSRFGIAKSMIALARSSGYDTEDADDMDRFVRDYNAGRAASLGVGLSPSEMGSPAPVYDMPTNGGHNPRKSRSKKSKRKMAKASRRKNRRK